jgi:transcriptional regulator with XRE-family HTH domain
MEITKLLADEAILVEMGRRVAVSRLDLSLTQAEVAEQAGVSKRTVERIESGASAQTSSFIRILRVLGLLPGLEQMIPELGPSPMALLRRKGKQRKRASKRGHQEQTGKAWAWDDDT